MRVTIIADPFIPVPPHGYGGTERVAALLGSHLASQGMTVDLVAGEGSKPFNGKLLIHKAPTASMVSRIARKTIFQLLALTRLQKSQVVINFGRVDYLWFYRLMKVPMICVFQNPVSRYEDEWLAAVPSIVPVGISMNQVLSLDTRSRFRIIYNSVNFNQYTLRRAAGRYLVFLGRLTYNKGVDIAIRVARECLLPLKIAGNISTEEGQQEFFHKEVEPHLGGDIEYIGPVNDEQKNALLGNAIAMLFPIRWAEPFGIVMVESMACGTPVIAFANGSVTEVIRDKVSGFICSSETEMIEGVMNVSKIDRKECRRYAEANFSHAVMAGKYVQIINEIAGNREPGKR